MPVCIRYSFGAVPSEFPSTSHEFFIDEIFDYAIAPVASNGGSFRSAKFEGAPPRSKHTSTISVNLNPHDEHEFQTDKTVMSFALFENIEFNLLVQCFGSFDNELKVCARA